MKVVAHSDERQTTLREESSAACKVVRDDDLDDYRALALIWVLLIHCLYLTGLVGQRWDVLKSLLLIEMPVLFYVAGASNGLGRSQNMVAFYSSRLTRILIPYWIYAAFCLTLEMWIARRSAWPSASLVLSWLVPISAPQCAVPPISWHLWFIPVYLAVMVLFPWLRAVYKRSPARARGVPLFVLAACVLAMDLLGYKGQLLRSLAFYSFWVYLGLFHASFKVDPWPRRLVLASSLAAYGLLAVLVQSGAYGADFQWNKFPPNLAFLFLGIGHFGLLSLGHRFVLSVAHRPVLRWIIAPYRDYGYTIYLTHALSFAALFMAFGQWPSFHELAQRYPAVMIALLFPVLVILVPVVAWPFAPAELLRIRPGAITRRLATRARKAGVLEGSARLATHPPEARRGSPSQGGYVESPTTHRSRFGPRH